MIAVFSGTSDGRKIVESLLDKNYIVRCFNATPYGADLYDSHPNLRVYDKKMDQEEITLNLEGVETVIDCTHPYARVISENLMDVTKRLNVDYIRYERPDEIDVGYESYEEIVDDLKKTKGNIFLTTGSNNLSYFTDESLIERVYCRVLPTAKVISKCLELGFKPNQIIGMQGPFDQNLNEAMFKSLSIQHLVTKSSGKAGGFKEKMDAAKTLNIETYVLLRPEVSYGKTYEDLNEILLEF